MLNARAPIKSITAVLAVVGIALTWAFRASSVAANPGGAVAPVAEASPELVPPLNRGSTMQERRPAASTAAQTQPASAEGESKNSTEAFNLENAQRRNRPFVSPLSPAYKKNFEAFALKWPSGAFRAEASVLATDEVFNPNQLELDEVALSDLQAVILRYDEDLLALAGLALENANASIGAYYDSFVGQGWVLPGTPETPFQPAGLWNLSTTVKSAGRIRRIRFDSADYPALEETLRVIVDLRTERIEAVRQFIEQRGER